MLEWGTRVNASPNGGPESVHAQMEEPGWMHVWMGEGFCKILLALWATWFIFFVCNHWCSDSFLTQQALHPYNISCIVVPQWHPTNWWHHFKVKGQGHVMVKVWCQWNPYFLSTFYQINSKLGVKVANDLPLSWIIFRADWRWPSWVSLRVKVCLPQCQIFR
jgi:hypothetical protein